MEKTDRNELPLLDNVNTDENNRTMLRQRLADLIGKLLARHWLKNQAIISNPETQNANRPDVDASTGEGSPSDGL